jgi:hypothetical protein
MKVQKMDIKSTIFVTVEAAALKTNVLLWSTPFHSASKAHPV